VDHKERHHLHHEKEREEKKREHAAHEREQEKKGLPIHPGWLLGLGIVLTLLAVLVWTLFLS
jgi:hypothetical protein